MNIIYECDKEAKCECAEQGEQEASCEPAARRVVADKKAERMKSLARSIIWIVILFGRDPCGMENGTEYQIDGLHLWRAETMVAMQIQ